MKRRDFLKYAVALPVLGYTKDIRPKGNSVLVMVELSGGNDGLNTLIPYSEPLYYSLRPSIAIPTKDILKISKSVGLHPSLKEMFDIYNKGELAIVQGLGYPHPILSHFRSIEIWNRAESYNDYFPNGWLSTLRPFGHNIIKGVVTGGSFGPLEGMMDTIMLNSIDRFVSWARVSEGRVYMQSNKPFIDKIISIDRDIQMSAKLLKENRFKNSKPKYPFPKSQIGKEFEIVWKIVCGDSGVSYIKVLQGGYDTHINQKPIQKRLLSDLSKSISILRKNLILCRKWSDILVATYSEFGRRVEQNANGGTDHGTANVHFVTGGRVKGGLYGKYPSLKHLDKNGNLIYTTDFRSYYNTIAKDFLHRHSHRVAKFEKLGFIKS